MNLLVTIPSLEVGGAEIFLARLLGYLSEEKGVGVYLLDFEKEKRDQELVKTFSNKITLLNNPLGNSFLKRLLGKTERVFKLETNSLSYKFYSWFLKTKIRKHNISLIHSHLYRSDKIIARCVSEVPAVTTLHGCYNFFGEERSGEMLDILSTFKSIVYIAERNLEPFKHVDKKGELLKKTIKIYNGLPLPDISPLAESSKPGGLPRIVVVSRCIKEKGWDIVIEAIKRLNAAKRVAELDLVGDGDYLEYLKERYADTPHLIFSGKRMDVNPSIASATICCFPSLYPSESFPNSILEYMTHKKPIISNTIGEVKSMLTMENGTPCAVLAPANMGKEELIDFYTREIKALLENPSKRENLSQLTGEAIKRFDIRQSAEAYLKLYNTFIHA